MSFGLPAIFIANDRMAVDNQEARAAFAQEQGAALVIEERELHALGVAVKLLLEERCRWLLQANCRRLARPNGASEAAQAIADLLSSDRISAFDA